MKPSQLVVLAAIAAAPMGVAVGAAHATPVTAILGAQYFEIPNDRSDADFNARASAPVVAAGSSLGPNGLPVGRNVTDVNRATGEITWWSPSFNPHVTSTGAGTISLPYANSAMYPPNSAGRNDSTEFETAVFTGTFTLPSPQDVEFQLGSDDDSFIYVDGVLVGQNAGLHPLTNVDFTATNLDAGPHTLEVFYADRASVSARLSLDLLSTNVVITPTGSGSPVPEPFSIALLGAGLLGVGLARRRTTAVARR